MTVEYQLGIDFGTTTTLVSLRRGTEPVVLPIGEAGDEYMPSAAALLPRRTLIGEAAAGEQLPGEAVLLHSIKRCIGCNGERCLAERRSPCPGIAGGGTIVAFDQPLPMRKVVRDVIAEALHRASLIVAKQWPDLDLSLPSVVSATVGCPVEFALEERQVLADAAVGAGLHNVRVGSLLEEAIAAGIAYRAEHGVRAESDRRRILVYDFGGGSLDTAILEVSEPTDSDSGTRPQVTLLATAGERWLGGDDLDWHLVEAVVAQVADVAGRSVPDLIAELDQAPLERYRLRRRAEQAKRALSYQTETEVSLTGLSFDVGPVTVTRAEFEDRIQGEIDRTIRCLDRLCAQMAYLLYPHKDDPVYRQILDTRGSGSRVALAASTIDEVYLVGGSSRVPLAQRTIEQILGKEKVRLAGAPLLVVVEGLARGARVLGQDVYRLPYSIVFCGTNEDAMPWERPVYTPYSALYDWYTPFLNNTAAKEWHATRPRDVLHVWCEVRDLDGNLVRRSPELELQNELKVRISARTGQLETATPNGSWKVLLGEPTWQADMQRRNVAAERLRQEEKKRKSLEEVKRAEKRRDSWDSH